MVSTYKSTFNEYLVGRIDNAKKIGKMVLENPKFILYASENLYIDREFTLNMVKLNGLCLEHIHAEH